MKAGLHRTWKVLEHNRGAFAALGILLGMTAWAVGCQSVAISPMTGMRLNAAQLAIEETTQVQLTKAAYDVAFGEIERQDELRRAVMDWTRPVIESLIGQAAAGGAVLTALGLLWDNRRKDHVIRRINTAPP